MKILAEISDRSLGLADAEPLGEKYEIRKSARAIVEHDDGTIAIQYLRNHFFHKLPGGGLDAGEAVEEAMRREVREEVGCNCEVGRLIGVTIEYRDKYKLLHISYCFVATLAGEVSAPQLEQAELDEGMETVWITASEALERMQRDTPNKYEGHFILARERAFLTEYLSGAGERT